MSARRFFALIAAAIVVLVAALSVTQLRRGGVEPGGAPVLAQLATQFGEVTQVTLRQGSGEPRVSLHRQDSGWTLGQRAGYPADSGKLRRLLVALAQLRIAEQKTADSANYAALGVDDPAHPGAQGIEVTITTTTGSRSLIIGKPAAGGNFVRDPSQAQSFLATPGISVDVEPRDWIEPAVLDLKPALIREVRIQPPGGTALTRAGASYGALAGLEATDVAAATDIDWKGASSATVALTDGSTLLLKGTVQGERHWLMVSATADSALAARTRDRAFELAAARYTAIFQP